MSGGAQDDLVDFDIGRLFNGVGGGGCYFWGF
jgi:hypothetical protein